MIKSEILDFAPLVCAAVCGQDRFAGNQNEVSVFIDLGGTVWFFLFVSHLCVFDLGRLSPEPVCSWRMGRDCTGNYRVSYQYQYSARLLAVYAERD